MNIKKYLSVCLVLCCILTGCTDRKQEFLLSVSETAAEAEGFAKDVAEGTAARGQAEETTVEDAAEETTAQGTSEEAAALESDPDTGRININTADKQLLMTLNGIGKVRAEAILSYREEYGPFQTVDDLLKVSGIGKKTLAKIKDRIVTG